MDGEKGEETLFRGENNLAWVGYVPLPECFYCFVC